MTDAEFRQTRKRIDRYVELWRRILWLTQWHIDKVYFRSTPADMDDGSWQAQMDIEPQWCYMRAILRFNMPALAPLADDDLERAVMHELCHCIACEMREQDDDHKHEERVVSHLTKAFFAARLTGWQDAKADSQRAARMRAKLTADIGIVPESAPPPRR